jgi:hypothetical protein
MLEELPDGRRQARPRPHIAETAAKLTDVFYKNGFIEGTTKRTPDECGRGFA